VKENERMSLNDEQIGLLDQPLDPKLGMFRKADKGRDVSYLEGYQVIAQANRIFGYDAWGYSVDRIDVTPMSDGKGMLYWALVTVNVDGSGMRQDVGCHVIRNTVDQDGKEKDNVNNPDQHDLARKSCVTDALKRAFRTFGDQFGNSLYDKDSDIHDAIHAAVREEQQQQRLAQRAPAPRPRVVAHTDTDQAANSTTRKQLESEIQKATTLDQLKTAGRKVKAAVDSKQITDADRLALLRTYSGREQELSQSATVRSA
jgi:DNA repair and recombination protein RAD52